VRLIFQPDEFEGKNNRRGGGSIGYMDQKGAKGKKSQRIVRQRCLNSQRGETEDRQFLSREDPVGSGKVIGCAGRRGIWS